MGRKTRGPVSMDIVLRYVRKVGAAGIMAFGAAVSAAGGLFVLAIHAATIGYLPEFSGADFGLALTVVLLLGFTTFLLFVVLLLMPGVLLYLGAWDGQQKPPNQQKQSGRRKKTGEPDLYLRKVLILLLATSVAPVVASIGVLFWSWNEYGVSIGAAGLLLTIVAIEIALRKSGSKMANKCDNFPEALAWSTSGYVLLSVVSFLVMLLAYQSRSDEWVFSRIVFACMVVVMAAISNFFLLASLRDTTTMAISILRHAAVVAVAVLALFGTGFVSTALRSVGLAGVKNVTLVIDKGLVPAANRAGYKCSPGEPRMLAGLDSQPCVIWGDLVTRIGQHYVLERTQPKGEVNASTGAGAKSNAMPSTGYFLVPKALGTWIPSIK